MQQDAGRGSGGLGHGALKSVSDSLYPGGYDSLNNFGFSDDKRFVIRKLRKLIDDDSKTSTLVSYSYILTSYSDRQKLAYVLLNWGLSVQETRCLMGIHRES